MSNQRISKVFKHAVVTFVATLMLPTLSHAALSPDSYMKVHLKIQQHELAYLAKVDALTEKVCEDSDQFQKYWRRTYYYYLKPRRALQKRFMLAEVAALKASNTQKYRYLRFQRNNEAAIKAYLETVPDLKAETEALAEEISRLRDKLRVPCYCLLKLANAQYLLGDTSIRINRAKALPKKRQAFLDMEGDRRKVLDNRAKKLYRIFDTTDKDYVLFMGQYGQLVEEYLKTHPVIKQVMDKRSSLVRARLLQYDKLRDRLMSQASEQGLPH